MAVTTEDELSLLGETKGKILKLLLEGPRSAGEISEDLQIQKSAARVHLESLQAEGAVKSKFKIEKMGRPKKIYELTEQGRELFPRHYDLFLNLILKKLVNSKGEKEAKEIVESVADDIASDITAKIERTSASGDLEKSLKILNDVSREMGFASSLSKSSDNAFSIRSNNCILHRIASNNQKMICHGVHDRIISKSLGGKSSVSVELKECMALGNEYCRHVVIPKKDADSKR